MSFVSNLLNAVATPTGAPIPPHELIRARLEDARSAIPALEARWREANLDHELSGTEQTASALALAKRDLEDAKGRVSDLTEALATAEERALVSQDAEARRQHAAKLRALEAHATTFKRAAKTFAARLAQAELAWNAMLDAAATVSKAIPNGSFGQNEQTAHASPLGHYLSAHQLGEAVPLEVARLVAVRDPAGWSKIGGANSRFLGVRSSLQNSPPGGAGSMPSFEEKVSQAVASLLNRSRLAPVAPLAPAPVPVSEVPALPGKIKAQDLDPDQLARDKAAYAAELTAQVNPGPQTVEQLREAWLALQDEGVDPPEGEELTALAAEYNAGNSDPDLIEEWQATQPNEGTE